MASETQSEADERWFRGIDEDKKDEYWDDDWDEHPDCRCDGSGIIVTCIDDLCRGAGECMHGDGEMLCPCGAWP